MDFDLDVWRQQWGDLQSRHQDEELVIAGLCNQIQAMAPGSSANATLAPPQYREARRLIQRAKDHTDTLRLVNRWMRVHLDTLGAEARRLEEEDRAGLLPVEGQQRLHTIQTILVESRKEQRPETP